MNQELIAGFARCDISPTFATPLMGYPGDERVYRPNKDKMLDPIQARALYLARKDEPGLLIVAVDLCVIMTADSLAYRKMIARAVKLPVENVWLACTHTHSAPLPRGFGGNVKAALPERFRSGPLEPDFEYGEWIADKLKKAARQAVARTAPVSVGMRQTGSGLGYNRRCESSGKILHCWNIAEFPQRNPGSVPDLRHTVLRMDYRTKRGGLLIDSIGVHPVVMGKDSVELSADWPAYARRHLERRMRDYHACFIQGAGAEIHPWIATQTDPHALRWVGEAIGGEALLLAKTTRPLELDSRSLIPVTVELPGLDVSIHAVELGELLLLALPFELSSAWAAVIEHTLARPVVFCCLTNGWESYWMSPRQQADGGYEVEVGAACGITAQHSETLLRVLSEHFRIDPNEQTEPSHAAAVSGVSKNHD